MQTAAHTITGLLAGILILVSCKVLPQTGKSKGLKTEQQAAEIFTSGFIDLLNNGQVNASTRFIRLYLGEPARFRLPLSFYSGVSSNSFQNMNGMNNFARMNEPLVNQLINPLSGLLNVSIENIFFINKGISMSRFGWIYQLGTRLLTGFKAINGFTTLSTRPINFQNSFFSTGAYFQTGAWERSTTRKMGVSWLAMRYHYCFNHPRYLEMLFPGINSNGAIQGYSIAFGIEITNFVNVKLIHYRYLQYPVIDFSLPIYQFSFQYSLK